MKVSYFLAQYSATLIAASVVFCLLKCLLKRKFFFFKQECSWLVVYDVRLELIEFLLSLVKERGLEEFKESGLLCPPISLRVGIVTILCN